MNPTIETVLKDSVLPWRVAIAPAVREGYGPTSCLAENLYKGVKAVGPAISTKSRLPILSHVHLYTREGCIWVEATDLEHPLRERIPARVNTEMDLCVPWRPFVDWLQVTYPGIDGPLELVWDASTCILEVRVPWERCRAEFKGMDAAEFPPIRDEDLKPRAAKPRTWAALCKQALKAGYTTITKLDGTTVPLLEAVHNAAYKPRKNSYPWCEMPVNPIGDGDYFEIILDQPETEEAEAAPAFPCPAIVRRNPEAVTVSLWKLGTGAVTITGDTPEASEHSPHFWPRDHDLPDGEEADYFDTTETAQPIYLGHMAGDPYKNAEALDCWVDTRRWVQDRQYPHWLTARLQIWMHRCYHAEEG